MKSHATKLHGLNRLLDLHVMRLKISCCFILRPSGSWTQTLDYVMWTCLVHGYNYNFKTFK